MRPRAFPTEPKVVWELPKAGPSLANSRIFSQPPDDPQLVAGYLSGDVMTTPARGMPRKPLHGVGRRFAKRPYRGSPNREASRNRRRKLGGSGALPADLRDYYTEGERAVLCVIASEIKRQGVCDWAVDKIAALAGVCRTTAQNALRRAKKLRHLVITERPVRGRKHDTNIIRMACTKWLAWLKRGFATACLIGLKPVKILSTTEIIDSEKKGAGSERGRSARQKPHDDETESQSENVLHPNIFREERRRRLEAGHGGRAGQKSDA
jgi:hypothetical protein